MGCVAPTSTSLWIFPSSSSMANQRLTGNSYTSLFPMSSTLTCRQTQQRSEDQRSPEEISIGRLMVRPVAQLESTLHRDHPPLHLACVRLTVFVNV